MKKINKPKDNKSAFEIVAVVLFSCVLMAMFELLTNTGYHIKTVVRLCLFVLLPLIHFKINKKITIKSLFRGDKKSLLHAVVLGGIVFGVILVSYYTIGQLFDFSGVAEQIAKSSKSTVDHYLLVASYVALVNSFVEEFFFRGFSFIALKQVSSSSFAYIFSALAFSIYHITIFMTWFSPLLTVLILVVLFLSGLIFDYLNSRYDNIYTSWLVHMCANFAINIIGYTLICM